MEYMAKNEQDLAKLMNAMNDHKIFFKTSLKHKSPFCCVQCWMDPEGANHLDANIEL